ncbi:ABC transporter ATP-binding protein [Streptomyces sp. NPDC088746]|uniref:ABC transporter ATP-binding protein n=1 Tax=Streptomyces sp. NPDC088746 TaxID=3365885 RepID=UPI0037FBC0AD
MTTTAQQRPPTGRGTLVLDVRDLSVRIRTEHGWTGIVDGVNLAVHAGETVGLVGESGSGKTVTSLAVMRLLPDNARISGAVRLGDRDIMSLPEKELDRVRGVEMAMIFQEPRRSLNPVFTVGEQVAESVRRHRGASRKEAWARAVELLDLVGIPDPGRRAHNHPHEFSGGMCQRVMLAMALACDPKVLIADEPTTALDVTVQRQVLSLIHDIQQQLGLGVLLITHDLGVVAEVCDRAAVMYAGRIVEEAPVTQLFDAPGHPYTAGLLHAMPDPVRHAERMAVIPGRVPPPHEFPQACRFAPRCPYAVEECSQDVVPLRQTGPDHSVRCARTGEIELGDAFYD